MPGRLRTQQGRNASSVAEAMGRRRAERRESTNRPQPQLSWGVELPFRPGAAFYEALLEAKGLSLGSDGVGRGKGGRKLSYTATVQGNGNLLIGKAYTAMLDLKPGDEFEIKLGRKQVRLIPVGGVDEEE
jgi:hypothetical protein